MFRSARLNEIAERTLLVLTFLYQGVVLTAFVIIPILAYQYARTPFLGAFIDNTMIANGVGPQPLPAHWDMLRQEVKFGEQVIAIDGLPVSSYPEMRRVLLEHFPGENVTVDLRQADGSIKTLLVTLGTFTFEDQLTWMFIPYFIGLVYLGVSLWIFGLRRNEATGRAFIFFATSAAMGSAGLVDNYTTNLLTPLWNLAIPMLGGALFELAVVFPQEARLVYRHPWLRWMGYLVAIVLAILGATRLYDVNDPLAFVAVWRAGYVFAGLVVLFFIGNMIYRRFFAASPIVRQQAGTILIGAILGFGPITLWFLSNLISQQNFNTTMLLWLVLFPITTGYTVLRYRMLRTDYVVSRSILYVILTMLAVLGYAALAIGLSLIAGAFIPLTSPLLIGLTVFTGVLLLSPVRARLQQVIDSLFFKGRQVQQQRIQEFTRAITTAVDTSSILRTLRENIQSSMVPGQMHIYIYDALNDQYVAAPDQGGRPTSDIRFSTKSPLPLLLRSQSLPLFVNEVKMPEELLPERARLALLGSSLFIPMNGQERLIGWLALGERLSGEVYSSTDLDFIDSLTSQAAVAIERSQIVSNMERRVRELNVLARVAQGINITLSFDDILELIYAQTLQVVPGTDFHITLFNKAGNYYYYAFCLENDDRLGERENIPIPPKTTLEQEVITARHAIVTQDYLRECQIHNVTPAAQNLYGWIGVPLNAAAETIGALSVSSRDPSIIYTPGQLDLLQAVADQAAGAIIKSRLLQETQRRAQQLTVLNNLTRQLTSTLEPEPLLKNILDSAVNILNTEAGSLFLVDQQTDELIFSVIVGSAAKNLTGQRMAPGTGVVGKAVATRQPVIVNEAQTSAQWNANPDKQTGFQTRSLLAIPMQVKDRVIGVIEVINKKDGLPFGDDDRDLLTAFAGQAAVAIENARLYTLTDQELAARVEELSVMQRIDRELNTSLDVDRAMRITLEWAMRQSEAQAGLIGVIEEKGVRLVAQQGYGESLARYQESLMPLNHPAFAEAVESGQAGRLIHDGSGRAVTFLPGARVQLVVPIRRESKAIGVIVLESSAQEALQQTELDFLSRLSDHAAIAIANAQLYAEVQEANIAKSSFVSFVAHELKNPMTSIKGYTELLAAGAVGQINEMQGNFLVTIRSNVERMSTLVSDLNDNSKIEAGVLRLEYKAVEIGEIVDEVIRSTRRQVEEKQQSFSLAVGQDLPKIWADRTRVAQVLTNLVSNAYKYTPNGGVITVGAERASNIWDAQGAPVVVHIWVKDDGIGISAEDQKKVFQKFFRSEDQKARESPGTGLGLNITKSLVEMQGGRIWFESEFRKGTTFHFTVPISEN